LRIEYLEVNNLRCKEIALVKVTWGGSAGESITWELEMLRQNPKLILKIINFND